MILYLNPLNSFFPFIPVIVLKAVNFSNFSLGKSLLSNLPLTCCAGETRKMVCSLECADYVICDSLSTCPAELQTGLRHGERYIVNYLKNLRFNLLFFFLFFALGLFLKMFVIKQCKFTKLGCFYENMNLDIDLVICLLSDPPCPHFTHHM